MYEFLGCGNKKSLSKHSNKPSSMQSQYPVAPFTDMDEF